MPYLSFILYVLIMTFTPGPNNIMAMLFATQNGLKKTLKFCLGVSAGFFILMILSGFFNVLLKKAVPKVEFAMTIIGVLYMLYLAYKIMTSPITRNNQAIEKNSGFMAGLFFQFLNPKGILFAITVMANFLIPYDPSDVFLFLVSLFLGLLGFVTTFSWSLFGSLFQRFLFKYSRPFNIVMGLLLIYSALSILIE